MHDLDAGKIYNSRHKLPLFAVQSNVKLTDQKSSDRIQAGGKKEAAQAQYDSLMASYCAILKVAVMKIIASEQSKKKPIT